MKPLIDSLPPGARVLDLGARYGSFSTDRADILVVRLDLDVPEIRGAGHYVSGDAARIPFASGSFDAIIGNHSLEHFVDFEATVREIGRVIKSDGSLFVAVPDASTLSDRIYRWMGRGGGHVNAFRSPADIIGPIERLTGLRHQSTTALTASLSFLNAHTFTARPPRKIVLFAFGNETFLALLNYLLRRIDLAFGSRLSVYGWAFYFGAFAPPEQPPWINVCVRCGSGASEEYLRDTAEIRSGCYQCPGCGGFNLLCSK